MRQIMVKLTPLVFLMTRESNKHSELQRIIKNSNKAFIRIIFAVKGFGLANQTPAQANSG